MMVTNHDASVFPMLYYHDVSGGGVRGLHLFCWPPIAIAFPSFSLLPVVIQSPRLDHLSAKVCSPPKAKSMLLCY